MEGKRKVKKNAHSCPTPPLRKKKKNKKTLSLKKKSIFNAQDDGGEGD